jgi:hypothetical protein
MITRAPNLASSDNDSRILTHPHRQHPLDPSLYLRRQRYRASHGVGLLHRLAGLEGTYAVALTAPTLFTALLRRHLDVTSETAALGQIRPRARTRGSLMVRNDVPPVSLGLSESTRGLTRYRHRVGCPRWPCALRLVMALWRRCATGKTPSHRLVGRAGPPESRRQATGSRSLTIRRLRVRACRRSNAASTSVDGGSLDQRLPTC